METMDRERQIWKKSRSYFFLFADPNGFFYAFFNIFQNLAIRNIKKFLMHGEAITPINKVTGKAVGDMMTDSIDISKLNITLQ